MQQKLFVGRKQRRAVRDKLVANWALFLEPQSRVLSSLHRYPDSRNDCSCRSISQTDHEESSFGRKVYTKLRFWMILRKFNRQAVTITIRERSTELRVPGFSIICKHKVTPKRHWSKAILASLIGVCARHRDWTGISEVGRAAPKSGQPYSFRRLSTGVNDNSVDFS